MITSVDFVIGRAEYLIVRPVISQDKAKNDCEITV